MTGDSVVFRINSSISILGILLSAVGFFTFKNILLVGGFFIFAGGVISQYVYEEWIISRQGR